ncbi:hypothetical protein [Streptomyces sp. NPDC046727]|uniref:hypothetical protein n=1 Tax=Streptomyces sp. NPDC046727 TaxID=3155373 RepID=UPI0034013DE0
MTWAAPRRKPQREQGPATSGISDAERELFGGRLRWDQSLVRSEGAPTRTGCARMAAARPRTAGMVFRIGWDAYRRGPAGVVAARLGVGMPAAGGLVAVDSVLTRLSATAPTADKLREALPSPAPLAVVSVGSALLTAWSTAMSGRLEPQVERLTVGSAPDAVSGVQFGIAHGDPELVERGRRTLARLRAGTRRQSPSPRGGGR